MFRYPSVLNYSSVLLLGILVTVCSGSVFSPLVSAAEPVVTFLYFNDGHQLSPVNDDDGDRGGVARLKTVLNREKLVDSDAVVLFGGDLAGGTLFGGVFKGVPMVEAFNLLPVDYAGFGQHDFDFGLEHTRKLVKISTFQWVTTNLKVFDGIRWAPIKGAIPYATCIRHGIKVGLLSITDAMETSTREGLVKQEDPVTMARACSNILKRLGCDVIVAITQTSLTTNLEISKAAPFIDVILSEERYENHSDIHFNNKVPIVSPCGNLGSVVKVVVDVKGNACCQVLPVSTGIIGDDELETLEQKYERQLEAKLSEVAGKVDGSSTLHESRKGFSYSGTLIAEAFRSIHKADVGIVQGGGVRAPLNRGVFRRKTAVSLLPFNNPVALVKMTGGKLRSLIEHSLKDYKTLNGNFLQVSGAQYRYTENKDGVSVITSLTIAGDSVVSEQTYTVALPAYIYHGGGGFDMSSVTTIIPPSMGPVDNEVLFDYVKGQYGED